MNLDKIEDMPLVMNWDLRHQMAFIFEVPTENVLRALPRGIYPVEARPGISLMFLGYNDYNPGNVIYGQRQPAFVEITRTFVVQPNLHVDMPMPRFTFFVDRIASNNETFIQQETEKLYLPTFYSPTLVVETNESKTNAIARDDVGPIQSLINTHPHPLYRDDSFFGQYYSVQDGKLYFGIWYWSGKACIHQRSGKAGGIHEHPFLAELPNHVPADCVKEAYLQIITTYDQPLTQRFYQPKLIRTL